MTSPATNELPRTKTQEGPDRVTKFRGRGERQTNPPAKPTRTAFLANADDETIALHTKDAYYMFVGQPATSGNAGIPGGKRFAAALKSIWLLSANDNPYADWILVRMYEVLQKIGAGIASASAAREKEITALQRKGMTMSILASTDPRRLPISFRSPYGYATVQTILDFDYYVRLIKTLVYKDRMAPEEGRMAIREYGRSLRTLFMEPISWERNLLRDELRSLSRADFIEGANAGAVKRVKAVVALFGELPRDIFTGAKAPRHTMRRVRPSDAELKLLEQASLTSPAESAVDAGQLL